MPKAEADRYVLNAEDLGCWIFAEWKYVDEKGEALAEGSTEASDTAVRQSAAPKRRAKAPRQTAA